MIIFRSIACLRFLQPLPELLQRDNIPVAFLFLFSILFTPGAELIVADAARLDPRKAPLVFSAVCLEYRVIGLFQRPLLECTDLPAFLLSLRHRPLAVLRADAPRLSKVAPAVFAPPHGDVLLHTALQGEADHSFAPDSALWASAPPPSAASAASGASGGHRSRRDRRRS